MKEALKLALEALCVAVEPKKGKVYAREFEPIDCFAMHEQAITAIKEVLAQPEQEPVEDVVAYHADGTRTVRIAPKRPWEGLTAQEAADCWTTSATKTWHNFEAALRSKNT